LNPIYGQIFASLLKPTAIIFEDFMKIRTCSTWVAHGVTALGLLAGSALAQDGKGESNNGTDPTKLVNSVVAQYEHFDLMGGRTNGVLKLNYTTTLDEARTYDLRFRVPVSRVTGIGNDGFAVGDASIQLGHVFGLSKAGAFVARGELIFNTAERPSLGTGKNVLKGTLIWAKFLSDGSIFAPAVVQSNSIGGDAARTEVNNTVFDFYYVPKLATPGMWVTYDPALTFDRPSNKQFASLAVTVGVALGKAFGGQSQVFIKPTVFGGNDRPGDWGLEVGYKIIGF
jgi:hypothetical protein